MTRHTDKLFHHWKIVSVFCSKLENGKFCDGTNKDICLVGLFQEQTPTHREACVARGFPPHMTPANCALEWRWNFPLVSFEQCLFYSKRIGLHRFVGNLPSGGEEQSLVKIYLASVLLGSSNVSWSSNAFDAKVFLRTKIPGRGH